MKKPLKYFLVGALVIVVAMGAAAWLMLRRGFSARDEPSVMEAVMARTMRSLAVPTRARKMPNPVAASPENIREGMEHFADHCATCHANNGNGDTMYGRGLYPKPPDMRKRTQAMTDGEIYYTIQNGIRLTGMPAFGNNPRDDDESTWKLVLFIRHLPALTAEEEAEMQRLNPRSPMEMESDNDFLSGEGKDKMNMKMKHAPSKEQN